MSVPPIATQRSWIPRCAGGLCLLVSCINLLALAAPGLHRRLVGYLDFVPGVFANSAVLGTAMAGIMMWPLAGALAARKRRAWQLLTVLIAVSLIARILALQHLHLRALLPMLVSSVLLLLLVMFRKDFYARPAKIRLRGALLNLLVMAIVATAFGYVFISVRDRTLMLAMGPTQRLLDTWLGLVGIPTAYTSGDAPADDITYYALLGLGIGIGIVVLYMLLRAPSHRQEDHGADLADLAQLLSTDAGCGSLDYFALRGDKSVVWAPSGRAAIAYAVVGGVMLVSGDPLGDRGEWATVMRQCRSICLEHSWLLAVAGCSEPAAQMWSRTIDLSALEFGDEAVLDTESFTLVGRRMRNLRHVVNRMHRANITVDMALVSDVSSQQRIVFQQCADRWRKGAIERGFSMALGRVCADIDPGALIAWAVREGQICGFIQFVPWGQDGWSLDIMRRDPHAPSGVMDLIISTVAQEQARAGRRHISLNFAPFRSALDKGERIGAGPISRAWRAVLLFASRWAQIESMYRFNDKFAPQWVPRYLLFPSTRDLARVTTAYLRAEAFLPRPRYMRHVDSSSN